MAPGIAARRIVAALLAVAIAAGIAVAPPLAREAYAATPDLTLVGDARYEVDPANSRVRVTVEPLSEFQRFAASSLPLLMASLNTDSLSSMVPVRVISRPSCDRYCSPPGLG